MVGVLGGRSGVAPEVRVLVVGVGVVGGIRVLGVAAVAPGVMVLVLVVGEFKYYKLILEKQNNNCRKITWLILIFL